MSAIDDIKERINIVDLVSETVKLRRTGKNYTGFCPFHPNSRTPAFVVFPDSGQWHCFGQCNEGGDVFRFVMKKEGVDFHEALRMLAEKAGIPLEALTPEKQQAEEEFARLRTLLEEAVTFYRHHLLQSPAGQPALAYLKKRGLNPETIEAFGLGYAPDGWQAALDHFTAKGYSAHDLLEAGLATERQQGGGAYDRFRNRIMFPIRDSMGRMCGFGARILNPDDVPKFLNSPQTPIFDKGRLLYGLDLARKPIRAQNQVVIVEGYLDVIALHQAGFAATVSPMGTALSEDQLRMLKRFTGKIILALDADAAGEKATLRGLEIARQTLDRSEELSFDARGLLRHEARLDADVRVTTLPAGMDPDEVVLRDPHEWEQILASAKPIVEHVMLTLAANRDLDDPKTKSDIAAQVLPLIEDVPDAVERDAYRQKLARLLRVDERSLQSPSAGLSRPARRRSEPAPDRPESAVGLQRGPAQKAVLQERHCLQLLLHKPDAMYMVDRALQAAGLPRISAADFEQAEYHELAVLLLAGVRSVEMDPLPHVRQSTSEALQPLLEQLLQPMAKKEPTEQQLLEDLALTLLSLRRLRIQMNLDQLRFMTDDPEVSQNRQEFDTMFMQLTQMRSLLDRALAKPFQFG
jgi:DNA primase